MSEAEFCEFDKELDASRMNADSYLKFIVNELKPYIDKNFSTNKGREHTFLMGSSMGGLISLYGLCEYPDVFGGAACLSMHTLMVTSKLMNIRNTEIAAPAFCRYLEEKLPEANRSKIYIDYGDKTLDSYYAPYQQKIDDVLRRKGGMCLIGQQIIMQAWLILRPTGQSAFLYHLCSFWRRSSFTAVKIVTFTAVYVIGLIYLH